MQKNNTVKIVIVVICLLVAVGVIGYTQGWFGGGGGGGQPTQPPGNMSEEDVQKALDEMGDPDGGAFPTPPQ